MSNFRIMSAVTASYGPQVKQKYRSSDNFPNWNTPENGKLKFQVIVPDGYPQPTFGIAEQRAVASDKDWYHNLSDNVVIDVTSGDGAAGAHGLYIGTTSKLPAGLDPNQKYVVIAFVSDS
ncbi:MULTISPECIES: hypothetical protein [Pseudomonas]|uniref:hypothetical protein n=1 Tax=Pseudomonas TaxID=286 RepID=UPI000D0016D3|nr:MULTISPECIES: hypothetical protein [Pseudomonas]PRA47328.1 hypothetical protein CQZ98_22725 [Pseudomonas sp. MYb115]QXN47910.1 hypothetical protein KW062_16565 [Pseudomonas fluorescens]WSO22218.1 hypothetical protein VUJ50_16660 [Pseudomonas fluorescens]